MEGLVLDDAAVHLRQCRCQEFSPGRKRPVALLLHDSRSQGFYPVQTAIQRPIDVADEPGEHGPFRADAGQPDAKSFFLCADQLPGWSKPEPGIYFPGRYCSTCSAKCSTDSYSRISAGHPATVATEQD